MTESDGALAIAIDGPAEVVEIAQRYGMIDGAHHKQWVIDRMIRAILGAEGYIAWRAQIDAERSAKDCVEWDEGVAP